MKQRIKLTESDLHDIIKESVKKMLKEWSQMHYDDYDQSDISGLDQHLRDKISQLSDEQIFNSRPDEIMEIIGYDPEETDTWGFPVQMLRDILDDERAMRDKGYAMSKANKDYRDATEIVRNYADMKYDQRNRSKANDDWNAEQRRKSETPKMWSKHEDDEFAKRNSIAFRKDGNLRTEKEFNKRWNKEYGWKKKADAKPLHRKGSLNRELMNKNESIDRIVKESLNKVICTLNESSNDERMEYEQLAKRVRELRNIAWQDDEARDELMQIKPRYLELREKLFPSTDHSAMSARFS